MKKISVRVSLFLLPIAIVIALPVYLLVSHKEFQFEPPVGTDPFLFGLSYANTTQAYKRTIVAEKPLDVLVVGTSRSMQFRDLFFAENTRFYNSGGAVSRLEEIQPFLSGIQKNPKLAIVCIDQFFFNPTWNKNPIKINKLVPQATPNFVQVLISNFRKIYKDYFTGKFSYPKTGISVNEQRIGANAIINQNGFRNDGSYQYGRITRSFLEGDDLYKSRFTDVFLRIDTKSNRFEASDSLSQQSIERFKELVKFCEQQSYHTVFYLPPFADTVLRKMSSTNKYSYLKHLQEFWSQISPNKLNVSFHDMTSPENYGGSDAEMIDGFHGSEVAYARMLVEFSKKDSFLLKFVNPDLVKLIQTPANPLSLKEPGYLK